MKISEVKLPRGERAVLTYHIGGEVQYVIATNLLDTTWYWRYNIENGKLVKQKQKAHNPKELDRLEKAMPSILEGYCNKLSLIHI